MDHTARRRRRNLIQNIAIALLSVSAVLLFAQLQLYNLGTSEDPLYLERLTGVLPEGSPSRLREFPAPVRVVLTDSYGRYGSLVAIGHEPAAIIHTIIGRFHIIVLLDE